MKEDVNIHAVVCRLKGIHVEHVCRMEGAHIVVCRMEGIHIVGCRMEVINIVGCKMEVIHVVGCRMEVIHVVGMPVGKGWHGGRIRVMWTKTGRKERTRSASNGGMMWEDMGDVDEERKQSRDGTREPMNIDSQQ